MRKHMLVFLSLLIFFSMVSEATAETKPISLEEIIENANEELGFTYFVPQNINGKPIRSEPIMDGVVLVYGDPYKGANDAGPRGGQLRYLGQTYIGEDFTNPKFPHDAWGGGVLEDRNWYLEPWEQKAIRNTYGIEETYLFDGNPKYLPNIQDGLRRYYGDVISGTGEIWSQWHNYVHILQPPTHWTWGMGRMWHKDVSGRIWYISIPLSPTVMVEKTVNLKVEDFSVSPNPAEKGDEVYFGGKIVNESYADITTKVRGIFNNKVVDEREVTIPSGGYRHVTFDIKSPGGGSYAVEMLVNPYRDAPPNESTYSDNYAGGTLKVAVPYYSGKGELTFQAVSQNREITRSPGTAKWTDWVTATLKPTVPTPPRGSLVWWEVTSAKLTYPKKNPDFTFGTPYPPVGTRTVSMDVHGHSATVEFQEDWGMDGAKIYSMLEHRMMAEEPKYYTITADYTIKYKYKYTVSYKVRKTDEDGNVYYETKHETKYRTRTVSGKASGRLLVNGTGVDSRAM